MDDLTAMTTDEDFIMSSKKRKIFATVLAIILILAMVVPLCFATIN